MEQATLNLRNALFMSIALIRTVEGGHPIHPTSPLGQFVREFELDLGGIRRDVEEGNIKAENVWKSWRATGGCHG
jgi:hypothetical protein